MTMIFMTFHSLGAGAAAAKYTEQIEGTNGAMSGEN
jgi:hypothetical protein